MENKLLVVTVSQSDPFMLSSKIQFLLQVLGVNADQRISRFSSEYRLGQESVGGGIEGYGLRNIRINFVFLLGEGH